MAHLNAGLQTLIPTEHTAPSQICIVGVSALQNSTMAALCAAQNEAVGSDSWHRRRNNLCPLVKRMEAEDSGGYGLLNGCVSHGRRKKTTIYRGIQAAILQLVAEFRTCIHEKACAQLVTTSGPR